MDAVRDPEKPVLRREVHAPERHPSGMGVLLLASAAMFFAVLGSAFIVRAGMTTECPYHSRAYEPSSIRPAVPTMRETVPTAAPLRDDENCGRATYVTHPDGTTTVEFRLCPGDTPVLPAE
jgi:hypothetical protein